MCKKLSNQLKHVISGKFALSLFFVTVCFLFSNIIKAQLIKGELAIGGSNTDLGYSIIQNSDGSYMMTGLTWSYGVGGSNIYIVKLSAAGTILWTKTVGGTQTENGTCIIPTSDKGYAISGATTSFSAGGYDNYVVKIDSAGNIQWTLGFGGLFNEEAYAIIQTADKGYVVTGETSTFSAGFSDIYVAKIDAAGNLKWTKTIGGINDELSNALLQCRDKGILVAGYTKSYGAGGSDIYLIKLDSVGNLKWTRTIGGTGSEAPYSIISTKDKGYALAGYTGSYGAGGEDVYVIKLDSLANILWTKTIGGPQNDIGYGIVQTRDNGYVVAGNTSSYGTNEDAYIIKMDSLANIQWTRVIGGDSADGATSVIQTKDGGYAALGTTYSYGSGKADFFMIKLDSAGNGCMIALSGGNTGSGGAITSIDSGRVNTGGYFVKDSGRVKSGGNLVSNCAENSTETIRNNKPTVALYPNPNNGVFTVKSEELRTKSMVEIYNMLGEKIYTAPLNPPNRGTSVTTISLSIGEGQGEAGIYLYRVLTETGALISEGKFIIQR